MKRDIVNTIMEACKTGELETETVLYAALIELEELKENGVLSMAVDKKFIVQEELLPEIPELDESDRIEQEIDEDAELTAQQKIIEKVLARYGDS